MGAAVRALLGVLALIAALLPLRAEATTYYAVMDGVEYSGVFDPYAGVCGSLPLPTAQGGPWSKITAKGPGETLNGYFTYGVYTAETKTGPGCVFRGRQPNNDYLYYWVPLSTTSITPSCQAGEVLIDGQCITPCAAQPSYGMSWHEGETVPTRVCAAPTITVVGETGGSNFYCWHYPTTVRETGTDSLGYYTAYNLETRAGETCAELNATECIGTCSAVTDPNATGGTGGTGSTGGTSGTGTGGPTGTVGATQYCNSTIVSTVKPVFCNPDGSGKPIVAAGTGYGSYYTQVQVPCDTSPNGICAHVGYSEQYSATTHAQVCFDDSYAYPTYQGPSPQGYNLSASSPSQIALAASSPQAVYSAWQYQGDVIAAAPPESEKANLVYFCQYVLTAVGDGYYQYKPLGSTGTGPTGGTGDTGTGGTGGTGTGTTGGSTMSDVLLAEISGKVTTTNTTLAGVQDSLDAVKQSMDGVAESLDRIEAIMSDAGEDADCTNCSLPDVDSVGAGVRPADGESLQAIWAQHSADLENTRLRQWLDSFVFPAVSGGFTWSWTIEMPMGLGAHVISVNPSIISIARLLILISAYLYAARVLFGR